MEDKKRDPFNEDNNDFRVKPNKYDTKRAIQVMKYIGCPSRPAFLKMAMELAIRTYGEK